MNNKFKKGFKNLLIKSFLLIISIAIIQLILANNSSENFILSNLPKLFIIVDLFSAVLASLILIFVIYKEKILNVKKYTNDYLSSFAFAALALANFISYLFFTNAIEKNFDILTNVYLLVILRYAFLALILIFLIISFFGIDLIRKIQKRAILLFLFLTLFIYFFVQFFHSAWYLFSYLISNLVYSILNIPFNAVIDLSGEIPMVGIDLFRVRIAKPCSGISSMFLFIFLYCFSVLYDFKLFSKLKILIFFIIGIVSVFLLNVLRICLIIIIGAYISKTFAIGIFHTGIAGILFVLYFALFWKLIYKFLKKRPNLQSNKL